MQWGISFKLDAIFESDLRALPPPTSKRMLSSFSSSNTLSVTYHFEFMPQSWREWQRIASIKIQMKEIVPHLIFEEYQQSDEVQRVYTVAELGKCFRKFIKYHKPLYPSGKDEFMRSLTIYAMRLHYEKMLHYEAVLAMALHFNTRCNIGYSFRELNRKARAIFELNHDKWRVKLSKSNRYKKASVSGIKSGEIRREKAKPKKEEAKRLRDEGMTLKEIADKLGVSLRTVNNWRISSMVKTTT